MASNGNEKIVDEHFWFTAITLGINAFVIEKSFDTLNIVIVTTVINIYAIFLILHRAAAHADKLIYPKKIASMGERDKKFYHKGIETLYNIRIAIKMIPYVIFEMSGAFFYILLILTSYIAMLYN